MTRIWCLWNRQILKSQRRSYADMQVLSANRGKNWRLECECDHRGKKKKKQGLRLHEHCHSRGGYERRDSREQWVETPEEKKLTSKKPRRLWLTHELWKRPPAGADWEGPLAWGASSSPWLQGVTGMQSCGREAVEVIRDQTQRPPCSEDTEYRIPSESPCLPSLLKALISSQDWLCVDRN